jgi:AcrR family transcriptional regulator
MSEIGQTEQKILSTTINCIDEVGINGVTVRQIAERADVNVAAINYYFRSKDRLIEAAMEQALHITFDEWMNIIRDRDRSIRVRYREILLKMVRAADTSPGITRAQLYGPLVDGLQETRAISWASRFIELLSAETVIALPSVSSVIVQAALVEMYATAVFVPLTPGMFASVLPFDLQNDDGRNALVEHLLDTFFRTLGDKRL